MPETNDPLSTLLDRLEERIERVAGRDAIDRVLAERRRTTDARSLRDHEVVQKFRQELTNGFVRADTAQRLLSLVGTVVDLALS